MLLELCEPILALGLGEVSSVGHGTHHDTIRRRDEIRPKGSPGRLQEVHIICDNYATHEHAKVKQWLAKHPRIHLHFTPTSASWLNMVERFFRDITEKCIRRGVFRSVKKPEETIMEYIEYHNEDPSPFIWTAQACDILEKVTRAKGKLLNR